MNDLFDTDGQLLICPGDLIDKRIILSIKEKKFREDNLQGFLEIEYELSLVNLLLYRIINNIGNGLTSKLLSLSLELYEINYDQWELEDRVRKDKTDGEAAYQARINNTDRVRIKNDINTLFYYPTEKKLYKMK